MDFITGLPKSNGYEAILVVVDRQSKYAHFILMKHLYSARTVTEVFAREVVWLHGVPKSIVSDHDPTIINHFWSEYFKLQGTRLKMSLPYHPETNGQTEVLNRCLETYLRCFVSEQRRFWAEWIHWAEFWYNTAFHTAAGMVPFEVVYRRVPVTLVQYFPGQTFMEEVSKELAERDEVLRQLKYNLHRAQLSMV